MQGIRLGSLWNYRGWLDASGGRCVDQGSSGDLDLIGVVSWGIVQGMVKENGGRWLKWHHHHFRVKVENVVLWLKNWRFGKVKKRDTIWQPCHDFWGPNACLSWRENVTRFWENVTRFSACWARFQDKVGRTLGRTYQSWHDLDKRDTILTDLKHVISILWPILLGKLGESHGNQRRELLGFRY